MLDGLICAWVGIEHLKSEPLAWVITSENCSRGARQIDQNWELQGNRLAKPLLEVAGLSDDVEIDAAPGVLTIRPSSHPRAGWAEAASSFEPEGMLDDMSATRFDDDEWTW